MVSRQIFLAFLHVEPLKPVSEIPEVLHAFWVRFFFFLSGAVFHTAVFLKVFPVGNPYLFGTHFPFSTSQEFFFFLKRVL